MDIRPIRRVVTGHDAQGHAVVVMDGPAAHVLHRPSRPGVALTDLWATSGTPAARTDGDPVDRDEVICWLDDQMVVTKMESALKAKAAALEVQRSAREGVVLSLEKLPQVCRDVKHIKRHLGLDAQGERAARHLGQGRDLEGLRRLAQGHPRGGRSGQREALLRHRPL